MHVARVRVDWPQLVQQLEAAGVDVAKLCRVDQKTVWRWKSGSSKPGGDNAIELWEKVRTVAPAIGVSMAQTAAIE